MSDTGAPGRTPPSEIPPLRLVRGTASIDDLDEFLATTDRLAADTDAVVQAFDAAVIVSPAHLREATRLAARAIARNEAVARNPSVEILLYAAGCRQIERAFELGVSAGVQQAVVLVADFGAVSNADRDAADLDAAAARVQSLFDGDSVVIDPTGADPEASSVFPYDSDRVRDWYEIADIERAATAGECADIVRERVALLDVEK